MPSSSCESQRATALGPHRSADGRRPSSRCLRRSGSRHPRRTSSRATKRATHRPWTCRCRPHPSPRLPSDPCGNAYHAALAAACPTSPPEARRCSLGHCSLELSAPGNSVLLGTQCSWELSAPGNSVLLGTQSNSPARMPATKAAHACSVTRSVGPPGLFDSLTATCPSTRATSTHVPVSQRLLRCHVPSVASTVVLRDPRPDSSVTRRTHMCRWISARARSRRAAARRPWRAVGRLARSPDAAQNRVSIRTGRPSEQWVFLVPFGYISDKAGFAAVFGRLDQFGAGRRDVHDLFFGQHVGGAVVDDVRRLRNVGHAGGVPATRSA